MKALNSIGTMAGLGREPAEDDRQDGYEALVEALERDRKNEKAE